MKLKITSTQQYQTVTAYDDAGIEINARRFEHSLLMMPEIAPVAWLVDSFDALTTEHFMQIDAQQPDVVILGTGRRQRFAHPKLTDVLTARRIGVECMDNQAACRTYNILMAEGRKVALALIIEHAEPTDTAPDQA
ncbi:MAG: Mth938-like domain-containing protein [Oxalobacteraceae bacterium]|nr:Mth938-like domain-containing protein [Oxalobacteraceae bacterium]